MKNSDPKNETTCFCPEIEFGQWEDRHVSFDKKRFLSKKIPLAFHLPIGLSDEIGSIISKMEKLKLTLSRPHMLLQRELGFFKGELLLAIDTDIGADESTFLTGKYVTTVYHGTYTKLGQKIKAFVNKIKNDQGIKPGDVLCWYANCPKCWEKAGGPVTILMARIGNPDVVK